MMGRFWFVVIALGFAAEVAAADFGTRGGPEPANVDEIVQVLRRDPYDIELLISYGTSKGGSAGHLALAIRDQIPGHGVPEAEKEALAAYFGRINDDYHHRVRNTEYHAGEVKYDYLRLNCAKTIGSAFKFGAGYQDLDVTSAKLLSGRRVVAAANANIPTEMAMKLLEEWNARGYRMDVVLYRKYDGSTYVDPHDEEKVAFKDLPNRFPSVLSRDFRKEQGHYEDVDNLFAMYLLYNMGRDSVRVNDQTKLLEIEASKSAMPYPEAAGLAAESARSDSKGFSRRVPFRPKGKEIGEPADDGGNGHVPRASVHDGAADAKPGGGAGTPFRR